MFGKNQEAFGHNGWGGCLGFGDPVKGIGIATIIEMSKELKNQILILLPILTKY